MKFLDPIGSMCRLIALNFRQKYTKISICNNIIEIQPPTAGQWIQRKLNVDTRDDISQLFTSITKIIEWYLVPLQTHGYKKKAPPPRLNYAAHIKENITNELNKLDFKLDLGKPELKIELKSELKPEPKPELKPEPKCLQVSDTEAQEFLTYLQKLCKYLCLALYKLQDTYEIGNVIYALQYYINIINDALDGRYTSDRLPKKTTQDFFEFSKIKDLWTCTKIKEICDEYDKCFDAQSDKISTEEENNKKIEGYLKAIEHLNLIADGKFKTMMTPV